VLTAYANVPPERAARVIGMLLGPGVSAGWVDKASARLRAAGFEETMLAALASEKALAADETPVSVLDRAAPGGPGGGCGCGPGRGPAGERAVQRPQAAPGRLRILAHLSHSGPLVPHPQRAQTRTRGSVDQQPAREDQVLPLPGSRIAAGFAGEARWPVPGLVPVPHFRQVLRYRPPQASTQAISAAT